jgi:hypothetical protein
MQTETVKYNDGDLTLLGFLAYDDKLSGKRPSVIVTPQVCGPGVHYRTRRRSWGSRLGCTLCRLLRQPL